MVKILFVKVWAGIRYHNYVIIILFGKKIQHIGNTDILVMIMELLPANKGQINHSFKSIGQFELS